MNQTITASKFDPKAYARAYRKRHREKLIAYGREYYKQNKERIDQKNSEWYRNNKATHLYTHREYVRANKEDVTEWQAEYRKRNRNKLLAYGRRYYAENADTIIKQVHRRASATPEARLLTSCRKRISGLIRRKEGRPPTRELLGCTVPEFRAFLEMQFPKGCNWENYGKAWHVDHIIPCAAFDLKDPKQLRQCFHFTNLRPLRAKANFKKHARITEPQLKLLL